MASYHKTIVCGNLGRDPEMRYLPNGDAVANFSVAVTEKFKNKDGETKESTTWYRINAFGKLAEICGQYLKKGASVLIDGKMQMRKYEKDGIERESWELRADTMQMLGGKSEQSGGDSASTHAQARTNSSQKPAAQSNAQFDDSDEIPF
jgi:single-strand DNA-binding protein